jgi:hypothetical protein
MDVMISIDKYIGHRAIQISNEHITWRDDRLTIDNSDTLYITKELEEWCDENLKQYNVQWIDQFKTLLIIWFAHDRDYILYKMRWC